MSGKYKRAYREKLLDGRWQIVRLKILERDKFTCQGCGAMGEDGATLNVHHRWYEAGKEPWEASPDALVTLCRKCHEMETELRPAMDGQLDRVLRMRFFWDALPILATALALLPDPGPGVEDAFFKCMLKKDDWMLWRRSVLDRVLGPFAPED